eukprot:Skav225582  [mRNA]  locus=scaffold437:232083:233383:- [translate_table: standard]
MRSFADTKKGADVQKNREAWARAKLAKSKAKKDTKEELDFSKNKPEEADLAAKQVRHESGSHTEFILREVLPDLFTGNSEQAEFLGSGDEEDFDAEVGRLQSLSSPKVLYLSKQIEEAEVESLSSGSEAEEEKKVRR